MESPPHSRLQHSRQPYCRQNNRPSGIDILGSRRRHEASPPPGHRPGRRDGHRRFRVSAAHGARRPRRTVQLPPQHQPPITTLCSIQRNLASGAKWNKFYLSKTLNLYNLPRFCHRLQSRSGRDFQCLCLILNEKSYYRQGSPALYRLLSIFYFGRNFAINNPYTTCFMESDETSHILRTFSNRVQHYRKQAGISQEKLAELANLHRTYIGAIERCEKVPSLITIHKISKALSITPSQLLD